MPRQERHVYRPTDDVTAYDAFCDQIAGAPDLCIRDDSTECECSRCQAAEDDFWREQGDDTGRPELEPPDTELDGGG
jgi:hypothetical protein